MSAPHFSQYILGPVLSNGPTVALIRTTTSVTMFQAGVKLNVIAPSAWAVVNHRIHPEQTVDEVRKGGGF